MTTLCTSAGVIKMALPFARGWSNEPWRLFSQCESGQKRLRSQHRVSPCVSLKNTNVKTTNKYSILLIQFKCLCTTKY